MPPCLSPRLRRVIWDTPKLRKRLQRFEYEVPAPLIYDTFVAVRDWRVPLLGACTRAGPAPTLRMTRFGQRPRWSHPLPEVGCVSSLPQCSDSTRSRHCLSRKRALPNTCGSSVAWCRSRWFNPCLLFRRAPLRPSLRSAVRYSAPSTRGCPLGHLLVSCEVCVCPPRTDVAHLLASSTGPRFESLCSRHGGSAHRCFLPRYVSLAVSRLAPRHDWWSLSSRSWRCVALR